MMISKHGEDAYFAASNSKSGFHSYYGECFDAARVKRLYAIKGGPGTGKSRFLREVGACGEGHGWQCEYIYCSSDPASLDGIILKHGDDCVALLDATAPHVYEPSHPGIREELINLGDFWDRDLLTAHREEIEELMQAKAASYRRAYRYLSAVGSMKAARDELVAPFVRRDAVSAYAERLLREVPLGKEYRVQTTLMRSVGMNDEVAFDSFFSGVSRVVLVQDCRGTAQYLMQALGELAVKRRLDIRISHDPICPDIIDGICLCDRSLAVVVGTHEECPRADKTVVMRRFIETWRQHRVRARLNYAERMKKAMLQGAVEAMQEVKEVHFVLESIYSSAMDFSAKENFTKIFCSRLFDLQNG